MLCSSLITREHLASTLHVCSLLLCSLQQFNRRHSLRARLFGVPCRLEGSHRRWRSAVGVTAVSCSVAALHLLLDLALHPLIPNRRVQKSCRRCQETLVLVPHDVPDVRGHRSAHRRVLKDLLLLAPDVLWDGVQLCCNVGALTVLDACNIIL